MIIQGNALKLPLKDASVHCCVTSPPYWGLRDYGIPPSIWGGDLGHDHIWESETIPTEVGRGNWTQGVNGRGEVQPGEVEKKREPIRSTSERAFCSCGAWRGQLGLEPTPEMYVAHLIQVFREVWRVLRDDGTLWLNMGDSYASGGRDTYRSGVSDNKGHLIQNDMTRPDTPPNLKPKDLCGIPWRLAFALQADGWWWRSTIPWLKRNCMPESVGGSEWTRHRVKIKPGYDKNNPHPNKIPGGYSRNPNSGGVFFNQAVWEDCPGCKKCNPNDGYVFSWNAGRPTTAVEYIFLLTKSEKYFYDAEAIKVRPSADTHARYGRGRSDSHKYADGGPGDQTIARTFAHMAGHEIRVPDSYHGSIPGRKDGPGQDRRGLKERIPGVNPKASKQDQGGQRYEGFNARWKVKQNESFSATVKDVVDSRRRRNSDWFMESWQGLLTDDDGDPLAMVVNSSGFTEAHFATFPERLVIPMIQAGTSERGCCPKCGGPWVRVVEKNKVPDHRDRGQSHITKLTGERGSRKSLDSDGQMLAYLEKYEIETTTLGWRPSCHCGEERTVLCVVFDPFGGACTTGVVCKKHNRRFVIIELKKEYCEMGQKRLRNTDMAFL